jgi:hypothetical protein
MIGQLRNGVKQFKALWWIILVALIAPSFFNKGMQDPAKKTVAIINGTVFDVSQFKHQHQILQSEREMFNKRYGLNLDINVDPMRVIDQGVNTIVMDQVASAQGFSVHPEMLASMIKDSMCEVFGIKPAQFNIDFYNYYIKQTGMDVREFEKEQERALARSMVGEAIRAAAYQPLFAVEIDKDDKKSFSLLRFDKSAYLKDAKKEETLNDDLSLFYEKNKNKYQLPDVKHVSYVVVDQSFYNKQVTITDEQIDAYYAHKKDSMYKAKDEFQVRKMLLTIPKQASESEIAALKAKAEESLLKVKEKPEEFAELAKTISDDKTAKKGGLTDWFTLGTHSYELESEIAKLVTPGSSTPIVKTAEGFEFAQLVEKKAGAYKSIDSVKKEIVKALTKRSASELFRASAEQLLKNTSSIESDMLEFAKEHKSTVESVRNLDESMSQGESLSSELAQKIFGSYTARAQKKGTFAHKDKNIVFVVTGSENNRFSQFEDIVTTISADFYNEKAEKALTSDVALAKRDYLANKMSFADIAQKYPHAKLQETLFIESKDSIKGFDSASDLVKKIFNLKSQEMCAVVSLSDGDVVLASLIGVKASEKDENTILPEIKKQEDELMRGFVASLKRTAKIELSNEQFLAP